MKTNRDVRTVTIGCVVAFACLLVPMAIHAAPDTIKTMVKQIKGSAHYSVNKGVWIPLKLHAVIKPGTLIKTGPESTLTLVMKESGSTLIANPNTILRITKLTSKDTGVEIVSEAELELIQGSVSGDQKKNSNLSCFKIDGVPVMSGVRFEKNHNQPIGIQSAGAQTTIPTQPAIAEYFSETEIASRPTVPTERPVSPGPPITPPGQGGTAPPITPPGQGGTPPGQGNSNP